MVLNPRRDTCSREVFRHEVGHLLLDYAEVLLLTVFFFCGPGCKLFFVSFHFRA